MNKRILSFITSLAVFFAGVVFSEKITIPISVNAAWSSVSELESYALNNWIKPIRAEYLDINSGSRFFGANRGNGRIHAANDYVCAVGTPVYAMTGGYIQEFSSNFYGGTQAISVKNDDGSVARYCEISTSLRSGDRVEQGQQIGTIIANNIGGGHMLHLEMYLGTASGSLTSSNSDYWYVDYKNYKRRQDLIDPSFTQLLPEESKPVPAPTYGILSADKVKIGLNEEITFTASSDYATNYTIGVDNSEGRYLTENMKGNTITLKFDKTGSYGAYVTAYNSQGYCDSAWIGFTVYDDKPSESVLTCNKSVVAVGEEIVFSASSDETATGYCIGVNKNDTRVVTENMTDGKISLSFDEPGNYGAYVTAWNDYGYFDSNWISFSVYNSKPTYSKLNSNRTVAEVGEPILFTAESEFATGCTIGIDYWTYGEETKVERIITESMNNRKFECKFDKPGSYSAYVTSYNDFGGIDSKNIFFTVTDSKPTTSTLSSSANKLVIGEEIEFYALSDLATSYWIGIDYNKKRYLTEEMVNGKFKCSFTEPGEYKAYVTSSNKYGGVDSECIVFRVYETDDEKNYNGDCNADGKINAADLVMLQQYMFDSEVEIPDCQAIDLSKDDIINIVDYIMLKNLLVSP